MSWAISNNLASSVAGTNNAERIAAKDRKKPARPPKRDEDTFEETRAVTEIEPARTAKGNTQEEAQEDRQEHGTDGVVHPDAAARPTLDLEG
jgi:hypothetical protein